jgi:general transcription factor 3C polypeptide 5 (transcription factor C subunit 1)
MSEGVHTGLKSSTSTNSQAVRTHIFDGATLTSETAAFQLCDIVDPLLKEMIEDESELRDTCNVRQTNYPKKMIT